MYSLILLMVHSLLVSLPPIKEVVETGCPPLTISISEQVERLFHLPSFTPAPLSFTRNPMPDDHPDNVRVRNAERHLEQAREIGRAHV